MNAVNCEMNVHWATAHKPHALDMLPRVVECSQILQGAPQGTYLPSIERENILFHSTSYTVLSMSCGAM